MSRVEHLASTPPPPSANTNRTTMSSTTAAASSGGPPPAAGAGNDANAQGGTDWKKTMVRGLAIYFAFNAVSQMGQNYFKNKYAGGKHTSDGSTSAAAPSSSAGITQPNHLQQPFTTPPLLRITPDSLSHLLWSSQIPLDFYVFLSSAPAPSNEQVATQTSALVPGSAHPPELSDIVDANEYSTLLTSDGMQSSYQSWRIVTGSTPASLPILKLDGVSLNDQRFRKGAGFSTDVVVNTPHEVMFNNGSIWADVVAVRHGENPLETHYKARTRKCEFVVGSQRWIVATRADHRTSQCLLGSIHRVKAVKASGW